MSQLNIAGVQASSGISGLLYVGTVKVTQVYSGISIVAPTGNSVAENLTIPFKNNQALSIVNINITGASAGISNYWFPVSGLVSLYDQPNGYYIQLMLQSSPSGRNLNIHFINYLNNATVNLPTLTFNIVAYLYSYPF